MHKSTPRFTPHRAKKIIYVSDITIFVIEFYFLFRHKCQSLCHHKKFQFRFDLNFLIPIVQTFSSIKCHIKGQIKGQYINKELKLCLQNRALDIIERRYLRINIFFKHITTKEELHNIPDVYKQKKCSTYSLQVHI